MKTQVRDSGYRWPNKWILFTRTRKNRSLRNMVLCEVPTNKNGEKEQVYWHVEYRRRYVQKPIWRHWK